MGLPVLARGAQLANRLRATNNIIRFGRKAKAVQGLSGAARAEILLQSAKTLALPQVPSLTGPIFRTLFTATSFLVGVWASLNKPKVKPDAPVDPLPSTGTFQINVPDGQTATVQFQTSVETRSAAEYWCKTNALNRAASTTQEPWQARTFSVVGSASITTATASSQSKCQLSSGDSFENKPILTLNYTNTDGESVTRVLATAVDGAYKGVVYTQGPSQMTGIAERFQIDTEDIPSPIPTPKPKPKPRPTRVPTPEVEPQTAPAKIPTKRPTKTPTRIPYANPLTIRSTGTVKAPVKTPAYPTTRPHVAPKPQNPTQTQTQTGTPVRASKAPTKTTSPADHFWKTPDKTYGRISGQTFRSTTQQIGGEVARIEQKLNYFNDKGIKGSKTIPEWALDLAKFLSAVIPSTTYSLTGVCECPGDDEDCEEPTKEIDIGWGYAFKPVIARLDALAELLQTHKELKQPTCAPKSTKGKYARSISFQSDENTERGNRRCTKRFGYRSNSPCELERLYEHWRLFQWNTGPVIVRHRGSALGSLEVWASSVDEGKRVISHAGSEAGIDPNQSGQWSVGSSNHPRYGLSHTVKLMEVRNLWQATAREGPDGYAEAIWTRPDL